MVGIMVSTREVSMASLLRDQFRALQLVGVPLNLDEDRQRRVLLVPERDWLGWSRFQQDGPMPAHPSAALMLRRLGAATYRLASLAGRRALAGQGPWTL